MSVLGFSTQADCDKGRIAVTQMRVIYEQVGRPVKWAAAIAAINDSYEKIAATFAAKYFPVTENCAAMARVGEQARATTNHLLVEAGLAPLPAPTEPPTLLEELRGVLLLGVVGLGIYYGARALSKGDR